MGPSPPRHPMRAGVELRPLRPKQQRQPRSCRCRPGERQGFSPGRVAEAARPPAAVGVKPHWGAAQHPQPQVGQGQRLGSHQKSLGKKTLSGTNRDTRLHPNHHHLRALNRNSRIQIPPIYLGKPDWLLALFFSQTSDSPHTDRGGSAGTHPRDTLSPLQKGIHYPQAASGRAERLLSD